MTRAWLSRELTYVFFRHFTQVAHVFTAGLLLTTLTSSLKALSNRSSKFKKKKYIFIHKVHKDREI